MSTHQLVALCVRRFAQRDRAHLRVRKWNLRAEYRPACRWQWVSTYRHIGAKEDSRWTNASDHSCDARSFLYSRFRCRYGRLIKIQIAGSRIPTLHRTCKDVHYFFSVVGESVTTAKMCYLHNDVRCTGQHAVQEDLRIFATI